MKCNISHQLISICMAFLCIMSSLTFKINTDHSKQSLHKKEGTHHQDSPVQKDSVLFLVDGKITSFKLNGTIQTIDDNVKNAAALTIQKLELDLKTNDKIELCFSKGSAEKPILVSSINYDGKSGKTDSSWNVKKENSEEKVEYEELGTVSNPSDTISNWDNLSFGDISQDANIISSKNNQSTTCFEKVLN